MSTREPETNEKRQSQQPGAHEAPSAENRGEDVPARKPRPLIDELETSDFRIPRF